MEIIVSFVSLGIALFALGWNIYKDIIQKPRFKVSFGIYTPVSIPAYNIDKQFIMFTGVNMGPDGIVIVFNWF